MNQSPLAPSKRLLELFPNLLTPPPQGEEQFFLRFNLDESQLGLIPIEAVKETLLIETEKITPIPNMPLACLGLMNARDEVFPVIDLSIALGIEQNPKSTRKYQVIVIDIQPHLPDTQLLGLIVPQIQGFSKFQTVEISELSSASNSNLDTAVQGVLTLDNEDYWILDVSQLNKLPSLK